MNSSYFIILHYDQQMHNYLTKYHTATCFDAIVSSLGIVCRVVWLNTSHDSTHTQTLYIPGRHDSNRMVYIYGHRTYWLHENVAMERF